jgi:hypothetical protein
VERDRAIASLSGGYEYASLVNEHVEETEELREQPEVAGG